MRNYHLYILLRENVYKKNWKRFFVKVDIYQTTNCIDYIVMATAVIVIQEIR